MNGLASSGLITMDEASCIYSTEAGRLMSVYYIDLETMKLIMKIDGSETLERLLWLVCESHELSDMHLRVDERRCLNSLNRNSSAATIRFPMKGKINSRQMKVNCIIQAVLGCLHIPEPSLNQEAMKIMRIADRVCNCLVAYTTGSAFKCQQSKIFAAILNSIVLTKCIAAHLWENSPYLSKQMKGIGPTFSTLLASAGKVNFMLLEESHPRDLERIMNKGPPAGNVLRKQISLLPKYQVTMTPIDATKVNVQLVLQNQSYLSENMEILTAGSNHKSYIIIGDSDNCLLHLSSFKDTDLISIYDGCITCEITRKHNQEHKIIAHCVSSKFVGIDAYCEYLFVNLEDTHTSHVSGFLYQNILGKSCKGNVTENALKERKRKLYNTDAIHCREKVKRDNNLIEKVKSLKESFGRTQKENMMIDSSNVMNTSNQLLHSFSRTDCNIDNNRYSIPSTSKHDPHQMFNPVINQHHDGEFEDIDHNNLLDDDQVNTILNKIEQEICNTKQKHTSWQCTQEDAVLNNEIRNYSFKDTLYATNMNSTGRIHKKTTQIKRKQKKFNKNDTNSNFSFIDLLEKDIIDHEKFDDISDYDKENGFVHAVKFKIDKYLQNAESNNDTAAALKELLVPQATESNDLKEQNDEPYDEIVDEDLLNQCLDTYKNNNENQIKLTTQKKNPTNTEFCNHYENNRQTEISGIPINEYTNNTYECPKENLSKENMDLNAKSSKVQTDENKGLELMKHEFSVNEDVQINHDAEEIVPVNKIQIRPEMVFAELTSGKKNENSKIEEFIDILSEPTKGFENKLNIQHDDKSNNSSNLPSNLDVARDVFNDSLQHHVHESSHVENYSFRDSKFHIYTKNTPSHKVHIISNWKMNLDVTKIVSANLEKQHAKGVSIMKTGIDARNDIKSSENEKLDCISMRAIRRPQPVISGDLNLKENESYKESDPIENQTYISQNTSYNDSIDEGSSNKIENILNKYCKIIRKNINPKNSMGKETNAAINAEIVKKTTVDRRKRMYKVSDIHNLEGPLPKITLTDLQNLNEVNKKITERDSYEISRNDNSRHDSRVAEIMNISDSVMCSKSPVQSVLYESVLETNDILYPECKTFNEYSEESKITYKPNKAILDPRTLLQCYSNIENEIEDFNEVIPPPLQFADECSNDSTLTNIIQSCHAEHVHNNSLQTHMNEIQYRNIFNDLSQEIDLTPSKEIETWTLCREDCVKDYVLYENPSKSCTVVRNNSPSVRNFATNTLKSRNDRLGQFKFTRKKVLNVRKY